MKDNRKTIQVLMILTIIFTVMGGSLAYWNWTTDVNQSTKVVFKTGADFSCSADGGGDITSSDVSLAPTTCTDTARAIKRKITVTPTINRNDLTISMDLWLDIKNIGSGLSASENFRYILTTSDESCEEGTIIAEGTFNGKYQNDTVSLLNKKVYTKTSIVPEEYYLYIWLDWPESSDDTMDQTFNLSLNGSCTDDLPYKEAILNGADPVLDTNGMIPVTIANNGTVTTADTTTEWYSYEDKEWANAILVTDGSRSKYLGKSNVPVDTNDILAYYVWIPRYSYAFPKADGNPESISINFESADTPKSNGTATGTSYYTHPAFTFENDNLNGIWVGKFETTPDKNSTCYSTPSSDNCNNITQNPTVLPNTSPLRYQTVSKQFTTSQKFSTSTNIYGINNILTDAHMMKNSEWGAVAYLSHSEYGVNAEVRLNNYYNTSKGYFLTGCGAATSTTTSTVKTCSIPYGSGVSEYPQSTTGNISGVFDMSGGAWEYVMGHYGNTIDEKYDFSEFTTLPNAKYYDLYEITSASSCTLTTCGGHALNETVGWYSDYANFVLSGNPWFFRGGDANNGSAAGAFYSVSNNGYGYNSYSWRSVLVVG